MNQLLTLRFPLSQGNGYRLYQCQHTEVQYCSTGSLFMLFVEEIKKNLPYFSPYTCKYLNCRVVCILYLHHKTTSINPFF